MFLVPLWSAKMSAVKEMLQHSGQTLLFYNPSLNPTKSTQIKQMLPQSKRD